jgi:hypothetical protein
MAVRAPLQAKRLARNALSNILRFLPAITNARANARSKSIPIGGTKRTGSDGDSMAVPLVDTVTVNGAGEPSNILRSALRTLLM